ncbi:MAG: hypothetical protein ACKVJG_09270 [Candidatus Latescibacterota bacterium]|jgi:hypothetical protein
MRAVALLTMLLCSCSWVEHNTDPFAGDSRSDGVLAFVSDRDGSEDLFIANMTAAIYARSYKREGAISLRPGCRK